MQIKYGRYRRVFVFSKFVIKTPLGFYGWLCNINEIYNWHKYKKYRKILCPIIIHDILGLFIVMPKTKITTKEQFKSCCQRGSSFYSVIENNFRHPIVQDLNENNLGQYKGKIVKIDYGNYWWLGNWWLNFKSQFK